MSRSKETLLKELLAQREALEIEANALADDLNSPGLNGEPPAGLKSPLVDSEGFPRGDIDLLEVRRKRQRIAVINTDHKNLMKRIETLMHEVFEEKGSVEAARSPPSSTTTSLFPSSLEITMNTNPFAIIDEILSGSPAQRSGLKNGDKLLAFGPVTSRTVDALSAIPNIVRTNVGKGISLVVNREGEIVTMDLIPQVWSGRGLLGCHLTPVSSTM